MSRNIADRLRSLDVKAGMVSPASAAVTRPAARSAAAKKAPPGSPAVAPASTGPSGGAREPAAAPDKRPRGRPPRHEEPTRQTTIRLSMAEWAALQAQVTRETMARGERRYAVDIIRDAVGEYLARHG